MKVEIGCGRNKSKGFCGIDIAPLKGVDIVADINRGIPLANDTVTHMRFNHSFEHFDDFLFIVKEMWRVCAHYARIEIAIPYYTNKVNLSNPYHKIHLTEYTFLFFSDKEHKLPPEAGNYPLGRGTAHEENAPILRQEEVHFTYYPQWANKTQEEKDFARLHYLNVVRDMDLVLRVIKKNASK